MTTQEKIDLVESLAHYCVHHELEGREILDSLCLEEMAMLYNGIGAQWMPESLRNAITKIYGVFQPAAFLHDLHYALDDDRSEAHFHAVNAALKINCGICSRVAFGWYNPLRYKAICSGWKLAEACDLGGRKAWDEAYIGETKG